MAPVAAAGELPVLMEVSHKYNPKNSKNDPVVNAEDWRLTLNVYMKKCDNYMRDERQLKIDNVQFTTWCFSTAIMGSKKS